MAPKHFVLIFIILNLNIESNSAEVYTMSVTGNSQNRIRGYFDSFTNLLKKFNDKHLGNSEIGKLIHYNELKHKIDGVPRAGTSFKKLSIAVIPLIFHMGATSGWVMLTSLMTVKSVAIGLTLLIFKIAVSSAKIGSFFTALKLKDQPPLGSWAPPAPHIPPPPPSPPHYDHSGFYKRSISGPYRGWKAAPAPDHPVQEHSTYLVPPPHQYQDPYGLDIREAPRKTIVTR